MSRAWWWYCWLLPAVGVAQPDSAATDGAPWRQRLTISGEAGYDSNVLDNALVWGLIEGGTLGEELRQHNAEALGSDNRMGLAILGQATANWGGNLFGQEGWMARASVAHRDLLGVRFSQDAYNLSFFGNARFEDRVAELGPGAFQQVRYQSLAFGAEHRSTGSFVEVGVVNGMDLNTGQLHKADLYTAPDGRYLDLALDGTYQRSDTADGRWSKGMGMVVALQWRHALNLFGGRQVLSCSVNDLGFVVWGKRSLQVQRDSTIHYEGILVDNILDLDGLILDQHHIQDSLGLGYRPGTITTPLPARFALQLELGREIGQRSSRTFHAYEVALDQYWLAGYKPRLSATRNLAFRDQFMATIGVSAGGFGSVRAQLGIEFNICRQVRFALGTPNVVGLCAQQANGKALTGRMEVCW